MQRAKRTKRLLLATCALTTGSLVLACRREDPLPGNPKGAVYPDDAYAPLPGNPKGSHYDQNMLPPPPDDDAGAVAGPPRATHDAGAPPRKIDPLPGNPKGSHYDHGMIDAGKNKPGL